MHTELHPKVGSSSFIHVSKTLLGRFIANLSEILSSIASRSSLTLVSASLVTGTILVKLYVTRTFVSDVLALCAAGTVIWYQFDSMLRQERQIQSLQDMLNTKTNQLDRTRAELLHASARAHALEQEIWHLRHGNEGEGCRFAK